MTCRKCGREFERPNDRGRRPSYCSVGCRRAAEYELRRVQSQLGTAEEQVNHWRRRVAGLVSSGDPEYGRRQLRWWTDEVDRLEGRLRVLLDDDTEEIPNG